MAKQSEIENHFRIITNPIYEFNDYYKLIYLSRTHFQELVNSLYVLRKEKAITSFEYHTIRSIFLHHYKNSIRIVELDRSMPRIIAQKFIGKQDIRLHIFNRDGNKCLCCGTSDNLSIDHIIPVANGGENDLSNLQTLCKRCNSSKGTKVKDYRDGGK